MGKFYKQKLMQIACFLCCFFVFTSTYAQQAQEPKSEKKNHKHHWFFTRKASSKVEEDDGDALEKGRVVTGAQADGKPLSADDYELLEQQAERNTYAHAHSSWYKESLKKKPNVNKAENAYGKYFSTHQESSSIKTRFETWMNQARLYKDKKGYLKGFPVFQSSVAANAFTAGISSANDTIGTWGMIGPANMNRVQPCNNSNLVTGGFCDRVYVNPYNTKNLFAGFGYGGLWVSTDQGANWALTDGSFANGTNTYANRDYYYGEIEANKQDSALVFAATEAGLLKSTNGGVNWAMCPTLNRSATSTARPYYIAMATDVQNVILSTFGKKVYRSADGGSTWTMVFDNTAGGTTTTHFPAGGTYNKGTPFGLDDRSYNFFGLEADFNDPNHFYLGVWNSTNQACIYESKDKGLTFTLLTNLNTSLGTTWGSTTVLAMKTIPSSATSFFVYEKFVTGKPCYKISSTGTLVSSNAINSYPEAFDIDWNNESNMYQGQYGVYTTESGFSKSTNGGTTFALPANSSSCNYVHSDIRGVSAVGNVVLIGDDGGLALSTDGGVTINGTGFEINSMDMWGFSASPKSDILLTGLDHNQTFVRTSSANGGWQSIKGADAAVCSINPVDDHWLYYNWTYGVNKGYLNANNTVTESTVAPGIDLGSLQFHPNLLYNIFGLQSRSTADTIFQSSDNMTTATRVFATFTKKVNSFRIARRDPKTMYVLLANLNIKKTIDSGATWVDITPPSTVNNGQTNITAIEVGKTPGELWAAYGNAQNSTKVLYSTNGGSTWTNITSSNLPAVAVNDIAYQRGTNGGVYIMTITGSGTMVWYKNNTMAQWQQTGSTLPLMGYLRNRMFVVPFKNKIRFGTSRGAYENSLYEQSGVEAGLAVDKPSILPNNSVSYYNASAYAPGAVTFQWRFPGGSPSTSTSENPTVTYATQGVYPATLIVTTATGVDSITVNNLVTVNPAPPVVTVTSPANNATYSAGSTIALTATASSPNPTGSIAKVDFYAGNTLLGTATTAPYSFNWNNVPGGIYTLTAKATDNIGLTTTSTAVTNVQVGVTGVVAVADAYVRNGSYATNNFGTATTMMVKNDAVSYMRESYVRFNFSSYTKPVDGAKLSLYVSAVGADASRVVSVYGITDTTWQETAITYNNQPAEAGTLIGNDTISNTAGVFYRLDVTSYIKNQLAAGHKTVSFRLINNGAASGSGDVTFNSREAGSNVPQLLFIQSQPLAPAVSISSPANNANYTAGNNITINATASSPNTGGSIAKVDFYNRTTLLGTSTTAPYSFAWNNVAAGNDTLKAVATDNVGLTTTSAIVSIQVNAAPTVSISSPANNSVVVTGSNVTINANASSPNNGGSIVKVDFYNGGILLGTSTAAPYTYTLNNVSTGTDTLTAVATDNNGLTTTSANVVITVSLPPAITLTAPANNSTVVAGSNVVINANASSPNNSGSIAKVDFYSGSTLLGTSTTAPYSYTWSNVAAGTDSLKAIATDNNGFTTTSANVVITVSLPPTIVLTAPANNSTVVAGSNIVINANASSPNTGGSITKVGFYNGSTLLGTSTAAPYSYTWNNVSAGTDSLKAIATDNNGFTTTSTSVVVTVANAPVIALTSPANNSTVLVGSNVVINANASSPNAGGSIAKVDFYNGSTLLGTSVSVPYSYTWNNVVAGLDSLKAIATDNNGFTTTSSSVVLTVANAPVIALTSPANNSTVVAGSNVVINANASSPNNGGSIAKVDFYNGGTLLGTSTAAPYSYTWSNVAARTDTLTAVATDNNGFTTTSSGIVLTVANAPVIALTSPANNSTAVAGSNVVINANASSPNAGGSITKIDFYNGTTLLGTSITAPYSFAWNNVAAGNDTLKAIATDNNGFTTTSTTVSIQVNAAPAVSITSPANNANFTAGNNITINATASSPNRGGSIAKVDFYNGTTLLGTSTTAPYSFTWNSVAAGNDTLKAVATDNTGLTTTSATVRIQVNAAPAVSITSPANNANFTAGNNITINATASSPNNSGSIAKVDFYNGTTLLGTSTTAPYSFAWNSVAAGNDTLKAVATDNTGLKTTSATISIQVNAAPAVSVTSPANNAIVVSGSNITLTANADSPNKGGSITKVDFYNGNTLLSTSTTAPYSYTLNNIATGAYVLTAVATDNNGLTTTSAAVNIQVEPTTFTPVADAYVRNGVYANTNYGTATTLTVKNDGLSYYRESYLRFDYSSYISGSVGSAMLKVYVSAVNTAASRVVSVYGISDNTWTETGINYSNQPTTSGTLIGTYTINNTAGVWYQLDVTSYINSQLAAGNKIISFRLINQGAVSSTGDVSFSSREASSNNPLLVFTLPSQSFVSSYFVQSNTEIPVVSDHGFDVIAYPNPSRNSFKLSIKGVESIEKTDVRIMDVYGRIINTYSAMPGSMIEFGNDLRPGIYFVQVNQGTNQKMLKVIKQ